MTTLWQKMEQRVPEHDSTIVSPHLVTTQGSAEVQMTVMTAGAALAM